MELGRVTHFLLSGSPFHMNGPPYANEFLKISRVAYGHVTKLVDVEFRVSLISTPECSFLQEITKIGTDDL